MGAASLPSLFLSRVRSRHPRLLLLLAILLFSPGISSFFPFRAPRESSRGVAYRYDCAPRQERGGVACPRARPLASLMA